MNEPSNVQIVQEMYAAFGRGDIQSVLDHLTEDVTWASPESAQVPFAGTFRGREQVARFFDLLGSELEIEQFEPREFIAQGDKVVVLGYSRARVRSTGREVAGEWAMVFTLQDGKVARFYEYTDTAAAEAAYRPQ